MKIKHLVSSAAVCGALVAALAIGGTASAAVPVRGTFTPVDPVRILDTRTGLGVADQHVGPLGVGQVIETVMPNLLKMKILISFPNS